MPRGISATLEFTPGRLRQNLERLGAQVDGQIHAVMEYQSTKALSYMKINAKWTDRTGNARNGLGSEVEWIPMKTHVIRLFHRVTYGIFLEVRWAGKYAIIRPTIEIFGPDTMRLLEKLFRRIRNGGGMP